MLDLTVPLERNIDVRHLEKSKKYAHFVTNISHLHTSLTVLAVSSTGNITADNKKRISTLQNFCKHGTKLTRFLKKISCLSIYSSYYIWLCRNDPEFLTPPYLPAPSPLPLPQSPSLDTWPAASPVPGPRWSSIFSQLYGWSPVDPCLFYLFV